MKKAYLFLIYLLVCIPFIYAIDPAPGKLTTIKIQDNSIPKIDSFFIDQSPNYDYNLKECYCKKEINKPLKIRILGDSFRVKFLLLDSSVLYSEYINIGEDSKNALHIISVNKKSVSIEKSYLNYIFSIVLKVLFVLIISFTFKVLPCILKLSIKNKIKYIAKYMIINSLYALLVIPFLFFALFSFGIVFILYPIILYFLDKETHKEDINILCKVNNVFFIITNIIFSIVVCSATIIYTFTHILNL